MDELKKELVEFFIEVKKYQNLFRRKTYETGFQECYKQYSPLIDKVMTACEENPDSDAVLNELASVIPNYVHSQIESLPKRSREKVMVDYNLLLVTFVIPVVVYRKEALRERFADCMIEAWNQPPVTMKIQRSDFETLNGSFKTHPCYITSAVCEMQNKPDNCYELNVLREYRDSYMMSQPDGERVVRQYYDIAPTIVKRINQSADAKEIYGHIYDRYLMPCIRLIEEGKQQECQNVYTSMVKDLQKTYLH